MAKRSGCIAGDKNGQQGARKGQRGVALCYLHLAGPLIACQLKEIKWNGCLLCRIMRKPGFCTYENNGKDQLHAITLQL